MDTQMGTATTEMGTHVGHVGRGCTEWVPKWVQPQLKWVPISVVAVPNGYPNGYSQDRHGLPMMYAPPPPVVLVVH